MTGSLDTGGFTAHARAKVNLALEILGKRQDGYHEIETILQSVNLYDELTLSFDDTGQISISSTDPDVPTDDGNTCYRAVEALRPLIWAMHSLSMLVLKALGMQEAGPTSKKLISRSELRALLEDVDAVRRKSV